MLKVKTLIQLWKSCTKSKPLINGNETGWDLTMRDRQAETRLRLRKTVVVGCVNSSTQQVSTVVGRYIKCQNSASV